MNPVPGALSSKTVFNYNFSWASFCGTNTIRNSNSVLNGSVTTLAENMLAIMINSTSFR